MKKIFSILLLGILLFNWAGYRLLTNFLEHKAYNKLEVKLDNEEYNEADLIEMRVPLNLPYQQDWQQYERFDGEIDINGIHYRYVKRKIEKGQLVVLCIRDKTMTHLQTAKDDFFRLVNDLQHNGHEKGTSGSTARNPVTDYWQESNDWSLSSVFTTIHRTYSNRNIHSLPTRAIAIPEHPPRSFC